MLFFHTFWTKWTVHNTPRWLMCRRVKYSQITRRALKNRTRKGQMRTYVTALIIKIFRNCHLQTRIYSTHKSKAQDKYKHALDKFTRLIVRQSDSERDCNGNAFILAGGVFFWRALLCGHLQSGNKSECIPCTFVMRWWCNYVFF